MRVVNSLQVCKREFCYEAKTHTHTQHTKRFKSMLVRLLMIDQHLLGSTSAIMCNLGLQRYAWTTFIHLSTTAQQNMITLF